MPPPDEIAAEIVESLEAALDRFRKVAASLAPANGGGNEFPLPSVEFDVGRRERARLGLERREARNTRAVPAIHRFPALLAVRIASLPEGNVSHQEFIFRSAMRTLEDRHNGLTLRFVFSRSQCFRASTR